MTKDAEGSRARPSSLYAVTPGRPEAAAPFLGGTDSATTALGRVAALRREGLLRALVAAIVAAALFYLGRPIVGGVAGTLAALTLALALASPARGYAALSRAVGRLGELVGRALALVLLAPVFFLFLTPFRLLFRRGPSDTLARGFDRARGSYWSEHARPSDLEKPY